MNTLTELGKKLHEGNKKKGFYDGGEKNIGEMISLIHSELSEMLEADRKGRNTKAGMIDRMLRLKEECEQCDVDPLLKESLKESLKEQYKQEFEINVKNSFEDEMCDVIYRTLDFAAYMGINLDKHIEAKIFYNSLRPYKHGKKY